MENKLHEGRVNTQVKKTVRELQSTSLSHSLQSNALQKSIERSSFPLQTRRSAGTDNIAENLLIVVRSLLYRAYSIFISSKSPTET